MASTIQKTVGGRFRVIKNGIGKAIPWILLAVILLVTGCGVADPDVNTSASAPAVEVVAVEGSVERDGLYSSREEVALYLHLYGGLPGNFITKKEAADKGWVASQGNLWEVAEGMSIGGDRFGNREGRLPHKEGRRYYECDVHYQGGFRGPERIVYSSDGLVYYTPDHYETFQLLYGEE